MSNLNLDIRNIYISVITFVSKTSIRICLLYNTKSISILRHRKYLSFFVKLVFQPIPICYSIFSLVSVLSIAFCRHTSYRTVVHRFSSSVDGNRCVLLTFPKSILLVFYLLLSSVYLLLVRVSVFIYYRIDFGVKTLVHMFSDMRRFSSFLVF